MIVSPLATTRRSGHLLTQPETSGGCQVGFLASAGCGHACAGCAPSIEEGFTDWNGGLWGLRFPGAKFKAVMYEPEKCGLLASGVSSVSHVSRRSAEAVKRHSISEASEERYQRLGYSG